MASLNYITMCTSVLLYGTFIALNFLVHAVSSQYIPDYKDPIIGFFPGTTTIPAKLQTNITIAFFLPYNQFWKLQNQSDYDACLPCSWFRTIDSAAELVVQEINNDPDKLPNTTINILRVQSWDANYQGPGAAVSAALHVGMNHPDVVAGFGDTSGLSTMITAGVLSQFKIPFCGGFQNLPALSDKGNYPYFFRVSFSNKWGSAIATLLNEWNVKRVAMIYDSDDIESVGAYLDIRNELYADGVTVLAIRSYHGASWPTDFTDILENLLYVDARYIIVCAQSWSPSYDLVSAAERFGLISPQHQWIVTNQPYPSNYSGIGQDARLDKMIGMIWPSLDGEKASSPDFQESERKWISAYNQNPVKYQIDYLNWVNEGAYDCLGTILYGLDGFLKMHGHPAEKLTSRALNDRLNFTIFQNTGFKGTLLNPMRLDSNGDITANTSFATISAEMFETGTQPNFCTVEKETGKFIALSALPVFFGGSNDPPPDGPPIIEKIDVVNSLHNTRGIVIVSAICFCYILCLLQIAFLLAYRNSTIVKALNVPHSLISISGCLIMVSGMIFYLEDLNSLKCRARVWFVAIGFVVMVLPLVGKNYYIFRIVTSFEAISTKQLMRFSLSVHGATIVGIIMEVILLGFWTATTKFSPKQYQDAESIFYLCHHHSFGYSWSTSLLWIFNSSVLLLAAYMAYTCRNVTPTYNESSLLAMVSVSLALLISTVSFLERNETQGLKEALAIFITATALPIILVGPVILRTFIHSDPTLLVTGGQTGTAQSMSMRSSKLGQTDSYQANTTWRGPVSNKAKVQAWYKKQDVVFRHCSEAAIWSPWKESPGVILAVMSSKRIWLTLISSEHLLVTHSLANSSITVGGVCQCCVTVQSDRKGKVEFEFEKQREACDFASMLMEWREQTQQVE